MESLYFYYHLEIIVISDDNQSFKEELKLIHINYYQMMLEESSDDVYDQGDNNTEKKHGHNREIKPWSAFFDPDIPRKSSNPVKFIMKEIDQYSDRNY